MKKRDTILIAISVLLLAFPYLIGIGSVIWENIPEKRKEIDFTLKYSLNGEVITISDTAICEFDRHKWTFYSVPNLEERYVIYIPGKEKKEDGHAVLSFTLMDLSDVDTTELLGYNASKIYYYAGCADFYMDTGWGAGPGNTDRVSLFYTNRRGFSFSRTLENDRAEELFGVRMISFDYKIRE